MGRNLNEAMQVLLSMAAELVHVIFTVGLINDVR